MASVNVMINGKNYRMACEEGQEAHLRSLAEKLDSRVGELKGSFGEIGDQRLTVMAGIMVADELVELEKKNAKLEEELARFREQTSTFQKESSDGEAETAKKISEIAVQIQGLARKLSGN